MSSGRALAISGRGQNGDPIIGFFQSEVSWNATDPPEAEPRD
jgi:hypothetical protein